MDLAIFDKMNKEDLRNYIEFLLWHYRVIDAFWYINISEQYDEPTADRLNEKVWGQAAAMAARDCMSALISVSKVSVGSLRPLNIFPGAFWSAIKLRKHSMK